MENESDPLEYQVPVLWTPTGTQMRVEALEKRLENAESNLVDLARKVTDTEKRIDRQGARAAKIEKSTKEFAESVTGLLEDSSDHIEYTKNLSTMLQEFKTRLKGIEKDEPAEKPKAELPVSGPPNEVETTLVALLSGLYNLALQSDDERVHVLYTSVLKLALK